MSVYGHYVQTLASYLGAISSTLHQKVKYPLGDQVLEILGSQSMARQCLIAAIRHRPELETSATVENDL